MNSVRKMHTRWRWGGGRKNLITNKNKDYAKISTALVKAQSEMSNPTKSNSNGPPKSKAR